MYVCVYVTIFTKLLLNYSSDFQKKDITEILITSGPESYISEGRRVISKVLLAPEGAKKKQATS